MVVIKYKQKTISVISDTHGKHQELKIPYCDILIHCGDACENGDEDQLRKFFAWFSVQKSKYKIFVAGNHDLVFDLNPDKALTFIPSNVIFLENTSVVLDDLLFVSFSARPWLHYMPVHTKKIDFLITHGPAYSILDAGLGCKTLLKYIIETKPKYHLFGHIHQSSHKMLKFNDCCYQCLYSP